ncbi:MAG: site-specific integrase [Planctomycetales bacterium]|nr:site-specific integrase [Planctomycetales bacterium]
MPRPRKNKVVQCAHFAWRLTNRHGVWYADGRSNTPNAGRHSLGTNDESEALKLLPELDRVRAEDLGLVSRSEVRSSPAEPLLLEEGRELHEDYAARPRVAGGVRASTRKRYRSILDKFIPFAAEQGVTVWNGVTAQLLTRYAAHLESKGYAHKTLVNELTTLKQVVRWLIGAGHLPGMKPIALPLKKAESQPAYCYRCNEVQAMVQRCRTVASLNWMGDVVISLACTGLRIAELCSLRWSDIDLSNGHLRLTDETGHANNGQTRREVKSGKSRSFPIHSDLLTVLQKLTRRDRYIFHGPRGGRLKPDTIRRILVREVIEPLAKQFPTADGERGFIHGRLHSFRHYFCSTCANNGVPERIVMDWLGHADSEMIRRYYHLHDEESRRRMDSLDFLGTAGGRSVSEAEDKYLKEDIEPHPKSDGGDDTTTEQ